VVLGTTVTLRQLLLGSQQSKNTLYPQTKKIPVPEGGSGTMKEATGFTIRKRGRGKKGACFRLAKSQKKKKGAGRKIVDGKTFFDKGGGVQERYKCPDKRKKRAKKEVKRKSALRLLQKKDNSSNLEKKKRGIGGRRGRGGPNRKGYHRTAVSAAVRQEGEFPNRPRIKANCDRKKNENLKILLVGKKGGESSGSGKQFTSLL